jgi:hypothetical protein
LLQIIFNSHNDYYSINTLYSTKGVVQEKMLEIKVIEFIYEIPVLENNFLDIFIEDTSDCRYTIIANTPIN